MESLGCPERGDVKSELSASPFVWHKLPRSLKCRRRAQPARAQRPGIGIGSSSRDRFVSSESMLPGGDLLSESRCASAHNYVGHWDLFGSDLHKSGFPISAFLGSRL